jgi:hypothetical protein
MSQFIENLQQYDMATEKEVAVILSHFNSNYVFDVIKDNLSKRFYNVYYISNPNIVASFDQNFKDLLIRFPSDKDNIEVVRQETYKEIINILCREYNLQFNDDQSLDYYSLAFYLYDLLCANYNRYITLFFANYINKEKNGLYDCLNMDTLKKNKDSSTLYHKKLYKDMKIAILNANLPYVLSSICKFDISIGDILSYTYTKQINNFIMTYIAPMGDFFKESYVMSLTNPSVAPIFVTNIRFEIQKLSAPEVDIEGSLQQ